MFRLGKLEVTGMILLLGNFIAIIMAVLGNFKFETVILIYVVETLQIFFFTGLTLILGLMSKNKARRDLYLSVIFAFSLIFVFLFVSILFIVIMLLPFVSLIRIPLDFNLENVIPAAVILFLSHGFSFILNAVFKKAGEKIDLDEKGKFDPWGKRNKKQMSLLLLGPVTRIGPIFWTIFLLVFFSFLVPLDEYRIPVLIFFMLLKTLFDFRAHQMKHKLIQVG
jgi:hypothetical protein